MSTHSWIVYCVLKKIETFTISTASTTGKEQLSRLHKDIDSEHDQVATTKGNILEATAYRVHE
jgi:hypothetical protein